MTKSTAGSRSDTARPLQVSGYRGWIVAVALMLVAAACSGGTDEAVDTTTSTSGEPTADSTEDAAPSNLGFDGPVTVVVPNSPGTLTTTGRQRVMTALVGDGSNNFLGSADLPVTMVFEAVDSDDTGETEGSFLTTNAAALGLYVGYFEFPSVGLWEVSIVSEGTEVGQALFEVTVDSPVPTIGDLAPATDSLTGTTPEEIAAISTDLDPIPGYYDLSIAEAVTNDRPTVVAFVTPAFCQTALCGPTLETVKEATAGRDDIDVVHVEPFDLELAPQGSLVPIPSMEDWGLVTEPWVFVLDADGVVSANFEGIIGLEELEDALAAL